MRKPLLHFGNISFLIECVCCGGRAQCMGANLETKQSGILPNQFVNAIWGDGFLPIGPSTVAQWTEKSAGIVCPMSRRL
jgi:hypothetical protein